MRRTCSSSTTRYCRKSRRRRRCRRSQPRRSPVAIPKDDDAGVEIHVAGIRRAVRVCARSSGRGVVAEGAAGGVVARRRVDHVHAVSRNRRARGGNAGLAAPSFIYPAPAADLVGIAGVLAAAAWQKLRRPVPARERRRARSKPAASVGGCVTSESRLLYSISPHRGAAALACLPARVSGRSPWPRRARRSAGPDSSTVPWSCRRRSRC
jgi:hypothetical protein